jgi:hypothetical protein
MTVFLHETLDPLPTPGAAPRYLDELGRVVRTEGNAEGSAGGRCIGAWVPVFLTGRWPQIVTFWEMPGGWTGFGEHFDRTPDLFHQPLERWYGERSGGLDRVLVGADYAPDLDTILAQGRRAPVVLQETVQLEPGGSSEYLERLGVAAATINSGVSLVGGYEVAFRNGSEVIVLWAFESFAVLTETRAHPERHEALAAWSTEARTLEEAHTGVVLRPTDWSPLR